MTTDQTNDPLPNDLTNPYENGQSEPEKLMRRHLQTPGDVITEEELRTMRIGTGDMAAGSTTPPLMNEAEGGQEDEKPVTPWDVLDP